MRPEFVPSYELISALLKEIHDTGYLVLIDFGRSNGGIIAVNKHSGRRAPDDIMHSLSEHAAEIRALFALDELQLHSDVKAKVKNYIIQKQTGQNKES